MFLHSGGNLGDRGIWSETARRTIIEALPDNRIVSLPQTIFFSDTPFGRYQKQVSQAVYARHGHLTVIGRDGVSGSLAKALFPRSQVTTMPDFVLSLRKEDFNPAPRPENAGKIMICLRLDSEFGVHARAAPAARGERQRALDPVRHHAGASDRGCRNATASCATRSSCSIRTMPSSPTASTA